METCGMDTSLLKDIPALEAADVAEAVVFVLSTPAHVQVGLLQTNIIKV